MTGVDQVNNCSRSFVSQHTKVVILVRFSYGSPYFLSDRVLKRIVGETVAKRFCVVVNS